MVPAGAVRVAGGELAARLQQELNASRKAQDKARTLLLGTTLAAMKNREIEVRRPLTDDEVVEVLGKAIKTRRESAEQYEAGKRTDLAEKELAEIDMLQAYMPAQADPEDIREAVRAAIAGGATDMGRIMGQVMPRFKGRADGRMINQIVREELQGE